MIIRYFPSCGCSTIHLSLQETSWYRSYTHSQNDLQNTILIILIHSCSHASFLHTTASFTHFPLHLLCLPPPLFLPSFSCFPSHRASGSSYTLTSPHNLTSPVISHTTPLPLTSASSPSSAILSSHHPHPHTQAVQLTIYLQAHCPAGIPFTHRHPSLATHLIPSRTIPHYELFVISLAHIATPRKSSTLSDSSQTVRLLKLALH